MEVSGFYGWRINQAAETEELVRILEAGESVVREPVYSQTAASHDGADYGGTYAEEMCIRDSYGAFRGITDSLGILIKDMDNFRKKE